MEALYLWGDDRRLALNLHYIFRWSVTRRPSSYTPPNVRHAVGKNSFPMRLPMIDWSLPSTCVCVCVCIAVSTPWTPL
jgi:hypothetical protein